MNGKSVRKNYILNLAYQIFSILVPVVTAPYAARVLTAEGIVINSYVSSMVSYFVLFAGLGTSLYGVREVGSCQNDLQKRSNILWEMISIRSLTSVIMLVFYVVFVLLTVSQDRVLYWIYAVNILYVIFDISWYYQGIEEFSYTVLASFFIRLMNVLLLFLLVKSPNDVWIYASLTVFGNAATGVILWICLKGKAVRRTEIQPFRHMKSIIALFIPTIAINIYTVLDKSMIGWFSSGSAENGYYEEAEKIVRIALTVVTAMGTVIIPRISLLFQENDKKNMDYYLGKSFRFIWCLGLPMIAGIFCVSDIFVPVFFGPGYEKVETVMPLLSFIIVLIGLSSVIGMQYLVPTRQQKPYTFSVTMGAAVNLAVNLLLIPRLFSIGAALGTIAAETAVTAYQIGFVRRTDQMQTGLIFNGALRYLFASLIMSAVLLFVKQFAKPDLLWLLITVFTGMGVYLIYLLIIRDEFLIENAGAVIKKIWKK
ncbi:MAG: flippase [Oscillospiraceae bacterium]|nr:flippase [Oscillospiraceae bacterium]